MFPFPQEVISNDIIWFFFCTNGHQVELFILDVTLISNFYFQK